MFDVVELLVEIVDFVDFDDSDDFDDFDVNCRIDFGVVVAVVVVEKMDDF